jgi:NAD(P)-dependent dehydrogenase (short-subunit alcohol dehydrogenase family)
MAGLRRRAMKLDGKVAIVTGGGRGIGKAIALALARSGADVSVAALESDQVEASAGEIAALGREALALPMNVTHLTEIENVVAKTVSRFGKVDILVNAAGIWTPGPALEMTEDAWDKTMNINLKGTFFFCQAAAREMVKRNSGNIISISSIDATTTPACQVHYTATKAGISMMTKALAIEWAKHGIRVNAIAPGWVLTDLTREAWQKDADRYLPRLPLGRIAEPEDIADVAVFLASDSSRYVTGAIVDVNGGLGLEL